MAFTWENLSDPIFHFADIRPDSLAIVNGPDSLTYGEFARLIGAASRYLQALGIAADDRVGLALDNHADHFILAYALMRIGAVPVEFPVEMPHLQQDELIQRYTITAMFVETDALCAKQFAQRIVVDLHWREQLDGFSGDARNPRSADQNLLVLLTSGTSGPPKGVVSTHRQRLLRISTYAKLFAGHWSPEKPGNALLTLSISNSGFHQFFITQLCFGGPVHLLPTFARFHHLIRAIGSYQDAVCFATANMCRVLLLGRGLRQPYLPNVQMLVSLGLPLSPQEKQGICEHVTPNYFEVYGASGFGLIAGLRPEEVELNADSVGRPYATSELAIVDAHGQLLPVDTVGHLRCRGPAMAEGFLAQADADMAGSETFRDGWYYPGDLASLDGQGFVRLKGRKTDLIVRNGMEIYPTELESVLLELPQIKDAAVIGLPAADGSGDVPIAVIVADQPLRHEFLDAYCQARLPPEKRPLGFLAASAIKKTPSGKTDRSALRAQAEALLEAAESAQEG